MSKNVRGNNILRTRSCPECFICGSKGERLYQNISDGLFGASGEWNLAKCMNKECGLIWLDPMPLKEDIGKAYRSYYTHQETLNETSRLSKLYGCIKEGYLMKKYGYYTKTAKSWKKLLGFLFYLHPSKRSNLDYRIYYIPAKPNGKLLEVGCGDGQKLRYMQELGWRVWGVDIDPYAVENCRRKGLQAQCGTVEDQAYQDNYFDVIVSSHVIEHVYDPLSLLRECKRILKPKGRLVIVTPNSKSWGHKIFNECWRGLEPPRHLHIFSKENLTEVVRTSGFSNIKVSSTFKCADKWYAASRSLKHNCNVSDYNSLPLNDRVLAKAIYIAGIVVRILKPDIAGEEVFLKAKK